LRFDAKQDSIIVVRDPDCGAPKFPMWLQIKLFANSVKLQIDFYRSVVAGAH